MAQRAAGRGELGEGALVTEDLQALALPARFALSADGAAIRGLLAAAPSARWLVVGGAVPEAFLAELVAACRQPAPLADGRGRRPDAGVPVGPRPGLVCRSGRDDTALSATPLLALTVNPLAPQSHTLDSRELRRLLAAQIGDVPIFDVLSPDYAD